MARVFISKLSDYIDQKVILKGWVRVIRSTKSTTFIVLQDASGIVQAVAPPKSRSLIKREDAVRIVGLVRRDIRAPGGFEVDVQDLAVVGPAGEKLALESAKDPEKSGVNLETLIENRPLSLRTERVGTIFRLNASLVEGFRAALRRRLFTEIFTSKIVAGGTEGGANLFEINYFDRVAYLAQSPQFYKEHGVVGLERVFETAHVYRAEPHASSRHLTEYYSLDFEMGFIEGVEEVIEMERQILTEVFGEVKELFGTQLEQFDAYLPSMQDVPIWTFDDSLVRLDREYARRDLVDDLDPLAERQLCALAEREHGVGAVFVVGFPIGARPFYTHPMEDGLHAAGFDLLFRGLEVTTGGQRLHRRTDLENALRLRGVAPETFEPHLRMFDFGMPPHGGLAIGSERLTAAVLGLRNVREATMYPRDRNRITP